MILTTANLTFNQFNTPESLDFGDVYFSNESGIKETDYVFINSNQLFSKWKKHKRKSFNIGETGFGTGLNFFRTIQLFAKFRKEYPSHLCNELYFCSTEKYPLARQDAETIFEQWNKSQVFNQTFEITEDKLKTSTYDSPSSDNSSKPKHTSVLQMIDSYKSVHIVQKEFIRDYPLPLEGLHRRNFCLCDNASTYYVILDLWYGDAIESLSKISINQPQEAKINAWFLDGFAPSKNEDMWKSALYNNLSRLSADQASLATFTAAGKVKRGLSEAGFEISKRKGFGRKRDMLIGQLNKHKPAQSDSYNRQTEAYFKSPHNAPYFNRSPRLRNVDTPFNIIGNGIAGAILAHKLTSLGHKVNLLWQGKTPADGASGNLVGGFYPQLNAQHNYASQIQVYSFLYAHHFYNQLSSQVSFKHDWCGALQIGFNDRQRQRLVKMQGKKLWPNELAHLIAPNQASAIADIDIPYDCLFLPRAGWISPPSLVAALLKSANNTGLLNLRSNQKLLSFDSNNENIKCKILDGGTKQTQLVDNLILAMGHELSPLLSNVVPLRVTRGQVELVRSTTASSQLRTLLCHKGYFTPAVDGFHALGSTYVKNDIQVDIRQDETEQNFTTHLNSIEKANWKKDLANMRSFPENFSRAAIRCSSNDHLPVVGALPSQQQFIELHDLYKAKSVDKYPTPSDIPNVFLLSALGSRGLTTAPLMAEILTCQLLNKPMPLSTELLNTLNPNRFIVRSLIRKQPWS